MSFDGNAAGQEGDARYIGGGASEAGWSRVGNLKHCPRWFAYRYGLRKHRRSSAAQGSGTLVHAGLAHHYARRGAAQPGGLAVQGRLVTRPEAILSPEAAIRRAGAEGGAAEADVAQAIACVGSYADHYRSERFRVLHVEEEYRGTIPCEPHTVRVLAAQRHVLNPAGVVVGEDGPWLEVRFDHYLYTCRADFVAETPDGRIFIADTKSTSRIEPKQAKFYSLSGQIIGLRWFGTLAYGERFAGVVLNLVQREPPFRFARPPLDPAPALLRDFPQSVIDGEEHVEWLAAKGRPFDRWPTITTEEGCYGRYGRCRAADSCLWGTVPADAE